MGELSEEEVVARAEARAESLFNHLDTNNDGVVDADEAAAAADERAQRVYDHLADRFGESDSGIEIDPDSRLAERLGDIATDGVVTLAELNSAFADHLSAFDTDGDGSITEEELSDAMVEEATERFDELDTNDDGVINADDRDTGESTDEEATEEEETTAEEE
jgi:ubiquinone biosynthesis protein UbiJ